jgi:hypothetical protein
MNLSARNKRKHAEKAMRLLPAGNDRPIEYAIGGGGSAPPRVIGMWVVGGGVAFCVAVSLLVHGVVIVGALPMLAVYFAINEPRGVLLTERGAALFKSSFLNGQPSSLLALDASTALGRPVSRRAGSTRIQIGNQLVWLRDQDLSTFQSQFAHWPTMTTAPERQPSPPDLA